MAVIGRVGIHGVHPVGGHGKAEHSLVGVGRAEIGPNVFVVVLRYVLALVVEGIAGGAFADKVQAAADVRLPVDTPVVLPNFSVLKQALFRVDGIVRAAAGKVIGAGKIGPQVVQIGVGKAVRVDEDGFVKGAALQKLKFVEVYPGAGLKQDHLVESLGVFVLLVTQNGEGNRGITVQAVGQHQIFRHFVVFVPSGSDGNKASCHEIRPSSADI